MTFARGVNDDENPPERIHSQGNKPLLSFRVRVFNGQSKRIPKRLFSVGKANSVLVKVGPGFGRVVFDSHDWHFMHMACISSILSFSHQDMLSLILPPDLDALRIILDEDPEFLLDAAAMVNCLGTCRLCERRFVPVAPFVESLEPLYGDSRRLHALLRHNQYISLSEALCGFCHADPGLLNMFQKMKKL